MNKILLDTNAYAAFKRNEAVAVEMLKMVDYICVVLKVGIGAHPVSELSKSAFN